jgi:hypothetical protein
VTLASLNNLDAESVLEGWFEGPVIEFNDFASMVNKLDIFQSLQMSNNAAGLLGATSVSVFTELVGGGRIIVAAVITVGRGRHGHWRLYVA